MLDINIVSSLFSLADGTLEKETLDSGKLDLKSWTKVVETLSEKDPFHSMSEFSMSNFDISTPSPLFNVVNR